MCEYVRIEFMAELSKREIEFIQAAAQFLERPGFLIRAANAIGKPLELAQKSLPQAVQAKISAAVEKSLEKTLAISISTLPPETQQELPRRPLVQGKTHTLATAVTGAVGGFFGPLALAVELPLTTGIMFRSIASIARSFGEDLNDSAVRMECLQVFAMGSQQSTADDAMNSAYFSQRVAFSSFIKNTTEKGAASLLTSVIARVAARYEIVVTEKFVVESLPFLGAAGGALINTAFTNYFNETAYYHFGLRYLEKKYGLEEVQKIYLDKMK